jgi:LPS sulfotransferase NodH
LAPLVTCSYYAKRGTFADEGIGPRSASSIAPHRSGEFSPPKLGRAALRHATLQTYKHVNSGGGEAVLYEKVALSESALNGTEFDQPPSEPSRRLIICTTPRSGSYLLARQLIRAGIGIPHEYFNPVNAAVLVPRVLGGVYADDLDTCSYVRWLEENRTTHNGVFAAKVPWEQMEAHPQLIAAWLAQPGTVCLFLYRKQLLSQAVSLRASWHSGVWDVGEKLSTRPSRNVPGLSERRETDHLAYRLLSWNAMWRLLFEANGIEATELAYEDFVVDQSKTIADIAARLGVICDVPEPEPNTGSGSRSSAEARTRYVQTWAQPGDGAKTLGYTRRLATAMMIDTARTSPFIRALSSMLRVFHCRGSLRQ